MIKWAYIENIVLLVVAGALAYAWDSGWPLAMLIFCNIPKSAGGSHE